jgi:hypothetical protein
MIDPDRPSDIGRRVVKTDFVGEKPRFGTIVNWTPDWVHVRFDGENFGRPEARESLSWEDEFRARNR